MFNIKEGEIGLHAEIINEVLRGIPIFESLAKFQKILNQQDRIYLPNDPNAFLTNTLSKSQEQQLENNELSQKDIRMGKMTAASRIFSTCEIPIIVMLYLVLAELDIEILPISYEADGLLLVGKFKKEDLPGLIKKINEKLASQTHKLFTEPFNVEFKKNTCD